MLSSIHLSIFLFCALFFSVSPSLYSSPPPFFFAGKCSCSAGYTGLLCHVDRCEADKISCQNGGVCKGGKCNCPQGWIGTYCQRDACEIRR